MAFFYVWPFSRLDICERKAADIRLRAERRAGMVLAIGEDNQRCDPPWYDLCLYVAKNAQKGKHNGLSRQALVEAATGKTGQTAKNAASMIGDAGQVIVKSTHEGTFDPTVNLTRHLAEIARLPGSVWPQAVKYLTDHGLSVKDVTPRKRTPSVTVWQATFLKV